MEEFTDLLNEAESKFNGDDEEATITDYELSATLRTKSHDLTKALTKFRQVRLGQIDNQHRLKPYFKLLPDASMDVNEEMIKEFFWHLFERQEIWYKRNVLKLSPPWTKDKHLANFKFTNTYRDLDRASQYLIRNVLCDPKNDNTIEDILFKIIIFRFYNQPDTFTHPKYAVELQNWKTFDVEKQWEQTVTYREQVDNPFHTAYLMNMSFLPMSSDWTGRGLFKDEAYVKYVFPKVHEIIPELKDKIKTCKDPQEVLKFLQQKIPAVSSFTSYEFYLDICGTGRYWRQKLWSIDEDMFVNIGPGCSLGIRLLFPSLQTIKDQEQAIDWLYDIAEEQFKEYGQFKYIRWDKNKKDYRIEYELSKDNFSKHILEFGLCEMGKRFKLSIGEGKQRSKFVPDNNNWKL
jgi:hypothetical protein